MYQDGALTRRWIQFFQDLLGPRSYQDTHALRVSAEFDPANLPLSTKYYETDRDVHYQVVLDGTGKRIWKFDRGMMRGTISPDQKPADLDNAGDVGFLFFSTDFAHVYRWNGTGWRYAVEEGDPGSGFVQLRMFNPNDNGVWQVCDGSTVTRSGNAGLTASVTVPDLINRFIKGVNAYTGAIVPAVAPSVTGTAASVSAGTPAGTVGAISASGTAATTVQSGTGASVAAANHTHPAPTFTGSALANHTHTLTITADDAAEPENVGLLPHMRL